jgi:hypothetical protein
VRSIDQIRTRKQEQVGHVIARSGMYATHGRELQGVAQGLLGDLCFIDERDDDAEAVGATLHRYGKLGVAGAFEAVFGDSCSYVAEVASIFAEQFHRLGYLEVGRLLDESDWEAAGHGLRDSFEELDVRQSEVMERLGEPSLMVDKRVYCYVTDSPARWLFFDFWENPAVVYEPGQGRFGQGGSNDLLLRDIRTPADSFDAGLVLTLYGKVLRWGPGLWLDHPSVRESRTSTGVREQLREIADADPSQSLGPRRP